MRLPEPLEPDELPCWPDPPEAPVLPELLDRVEAPLPLPLLLPLLPLVPPRVPLLMLEPMPAAVPMPLVEPPDPLDEPVDDDPMAAEDGEAELLPVEGEDGEPDDDAALDPLGEDEPGVVALEEEEGVVGDVDMSVSVEGEKEEPAAPCRRGRAGLARGCRSTPPRVGNSHAVKGSSWAGGSRNGVRAGAAGVVRRPSARSGRPQHQQAQRVRPLMMQGRPTPSP